MMSSRWFQVAAAVTLTVLGAVGAAATPHGAREAQISIEQFKFAPARVTIAPGGTVTWVNGDAEEHTVTASDRSYSSEGLEQRETYVHRFTAPGTYTYYCALHPHMTATVVVQ